MELIEACSLAKENRFISYWLAVLNFCYVGPFYSIAIKTMIAIFCYSSIHFSPSNPADTT